jgi:hypothetical protein
MASKSETGYVVFMTDLEKLWQSTVGFGTAYQPGNTDLLPAAIKVELDAERDLLKKLNIKAAPWVKAVDEREDEIEVLSTLCRRVWESTVSSKASSKFADDVKSLVKKITGVRATPKIVMTKDATPLPTDESITQISASQMGIDNRLNHFDALIQLLKTEPAYDPAEADLKITALEAKHTAISGKNSAVIAAHPALDTARNQLKDKLYFATGNGAELSRKVKKYVRSAFGPSSWQYKQISGLKFTKPAK